MKGLSTVIDMSGAEKALGSIPSTPENVPQCPTQEVTWSRDMPQPSSNGTLWPFLVPVLKR